MNQQPGRHAILAVTSIAHFINDGTVFFVPVIAAIAVAEQRIDPLVVTVLFLVFYGAQPVMSPIVGRIADRFGRLRAMMAAGLAILSMGLFGFYLALDLTNGPLLVIALLSAALVTGTGAAFYHPVGASLLQSAYRANRRGLALGINGALGSLGRASYPSLYFLVGLVIVGYGSIAAFAGIGIAAALVIWTTAHRPAPSEGPTLHNAPASSREAVTRAIVILTLVAFFRSLATRGIAAWIPTHLATVRSLGASADLGIAVTITYAAAVIGQPLFGLIVDRMDKRLVLAAASVGSAVCIFGYLSAGLSTTAYVWLFAFGLFTFSGFPLLLSMVNDYVPRRSSSLANALVWGVGNSAGNAVGPVLVGLAIGGDASALESAFIACAVIAVIASLAAAFVPAPSSVGKMAAFGG